MRLHASCICMYVSMYACMYVCSLHSWKLMERLDLCTCMHTYIHTLDTHPCIHTYIHTYTYTQTHKHTYIHTHTLTHIHAYIHRYIHTQIRVGARMLFSRLRLLLLWCKDCLQKDRFWTIDLRSGKIYRRKHTTQVHIRVHV